MSWDGDVWNKVKDRVESTGWRKIFGRHYELPNGAVKGYDIADHHDSTMVLAITEDEQVILVQQFRPGPEKVFLELPGGIIDPGEDSLVGAERELLEETGHNGDLHLIATLWLDAYSTGRKFIYLATGCRWVQEQQTDEDEFIDVVLMPLSEFREWLHGDSEILDNNCAFRALRYYDSQHLDQ